MINTSTRGPFVWFDRLLARIGVCGNAGMIVGIVTGFALTLLDLIEEGLELTAQDALLLWLITAGFGWLMLLFVFVVLVHWTLDSVVLPTVVNSLLVTGLTVLICWVAELFPIAWLVGVLVGLLIGFLLCSLYRFARRG